jgi:hypothetical protein
MKKYTLLMLLCFSSWLFAATQPPVGYPALQCDKYRTSQADILATIKMFGANPQGLGVQECAGVSCGANQTCCQIAGSEKYVCCPFPNASCCGDGHSCCPSGYTCTPNEHVYYCVPNSNDVASRNATNNNQK